jgi:hypothetical protein
LESEQKARAKLEKTIQDLDEIYEDQKIEHENMQQQLLNKVFVHLLKYFLSSKVIGSEFFII